MPIGKHLKGLYTEVQPTAEEIQKWRREHPRDPHPYRVRCNLDGTRMWWSGLGRGAHERSALHSNAVRESMSGRSRQRPVKYAEIHHFPHGTGSPYSVILYTSEQKPPFSGLSIGSAKTETDARNIARIHGAESVRVTGHYRKRDKKDDPGWRKRWDKFVSTGRLRRNHSHPTHPYNHPVTTKHRRARR